MKNYWISIYRPGGYRPGAEENETMRAEIDALNAEMVAAGVRVFVGGLTPPEQAKSLRRQEDGGIATEDGPYLNAGESVGGFWVIACSERDAALEWGRKAAVACRAPVEVRPFNE